MLLNRVKNNHFSFLHYSWERDLSDWTGIATTCLLKQGVCFADLLPCPLRSTQTSLEKFHFICLWRRRGPSDICQHQQQRQMTMFGTSRTGLGFLEQGNHSSFPHLKIPSILYSQPCLSFLVEAFGWEKKGVSSN